MPINPLAAVAGVLFLAFGVVEWLLFRLEENGEKRQRALAFAAVGSACLIVSPFLTGGQRAGTVPALGRPRPAAAVATAEEHLGDDIAFMERVARGEITPTLAAIQDNRRRLLDARRVVAHRLGQETPIRALESQADTALGVAFQTLGSEWALVKANRWQDAEERRKATSQLRDELDRWYQIRDCLRSGRNDCVPILSLNSRQTAVRDFNRWLHPYGVELVRFEETDPDLVDSSAWETRRLREVLTQARRELAARPVEDWAAPVVAAADHLLAAAELAVIRESALIGQGAWGAAGQERAFDPVRDAWALYFQTAQCVTGTHPEMCGKVRGARS